MNKEHHDGRRPDDDPADVVAKAMGGEHLETSDFQIFSGAISSG
jgi:hypothetical protein